MLSDKDMALDYLEMCKTGTSEALKAALECSNQNLRGTLMSYVTQGEKDSLELSKLASTNNWYLEAGPADSQEIQRISGFYTSAATPMGFTVR
ncbi:MAG: spore coat protein [Limnochordia bacterium]|jgi:spore coat protein CotF|nr:spore coat protein [Limnochordia bacterium]MDD2629941.1 spore coat protein [Limnochordia bacterium]MDD4518819.1 spore coat protein [Limnochordia bacterium]